MNTPQHIPTDIPTQRSDGAPFMRRKDPILEEVYSVKAKLNAEANYSVEKILERSRQTSASFNLR
jgi:hypothetical protein